MESDFRTENVHYINRSSNVEHTPLLDQKNCTMIAATSNSSVSLYNLERNMALQETLDNDKEKSRILSLLSIQPDFFMRIQISRAVTK